MGLAACGPEARPVTNAPRDMSRSERKKWWKKGIKNDKETTTGIEESVNGKREGDHCKTDPIASATEAMQA